MLFRRLEFKFSSLVLLLLLQILLMVCYILMVPFSHHQVTTVNTNLQSVKFLSLPYQEPTAKQDVQKFFSESSSIILPETTHDPYFYTINSTTCFILGTELGYMRRRGNITRCECKKGWHGTDCGLPEVMWRAFMASKRKILPRRRLQPRRVIYGFPVIGKETQLAEITLHELFKVVDLYVVCESNYTRLGEQKKLYFKNRLMKHFLKGTEHKILYLSADVYKQQSKITSDTYFNHLERIVWSKSISTIKNLHSDDLFVVMNAYEIPNAKAILYLKLYDGWPQPVGFRLRWSAYGFFWQHPKKTVVVPRGATAQLMKDLYHSDAGSHRGDKDHRTWREFKMVVGDLNHYGGWYCSWCLEPSAIVDTLAQTPPSASPVLWSAGDHKVVDSRYVEDLIGTGIWLDGKTPLLRCYRHRDPYFAPEYVMNNTWMYDSLITNFYSDIDYN
ncbi:beta-1,4-mannosyl-glycoprotein 4-beta-N-acetylglucosaminyltransferase [Bacillus rossius redtenbacheri]|uniref:beta-1,4-mannosyl-glycoprotein 4-beta-N-acetylglucosaminyltransferase n=1 Tax=Bacillus rossius redtenbacheri TaxID=93214 RepID=UPI002FDEBAEC